MSTSHITLFRRSITNLLLAGICVMLASCMAAPTLPTPPDKETALTEPSSAYLEETPVNTPASTLEQSQPSVAITPPKRFQAV